MAATGAQTGLQAIPMGRAAAGKNNKGGLLGVALAILRKAETLKQVEDQGEGPQQPQDHQN